MKDQYFGDINDYLKYGLLRSISHSSGFRILVAWMLTHDEITSDGKFISYLQDPKKWSNFDPPLFEKLKQFVEREKRQVSLIEKTELIKNALYFQDKTPDSRVDRMEWFKKLIKCAEESDLIFLDPDNGLEVKSRKYGLKNSSKYLYWREEVKCLWDSGKSLLIYQHFIREKRCLYVQRILKELKNFTLGSFVVAFSTRNVVFLMALQPGHGDFYEPIIQAVQKNWGEEIKPEYYTSSKTT